MARMKPALEAWRSKDSTYQCDAVFASVPSVLGKITSKLCGAESVRAGREEKLKLSFRVEGWHKWRTRMHGLGIRVHFNAESDYNDTVLEEGPTFFQVIFVVDKRRVLEAAFIVAQRTYAHIGLRL